MTKLGLLIGTSVLLAVAAPASATTIFDPAGDFLPSYTGVQSPDLDVLSFTVLYNSATNAFTLGWTVNGVIDASVPGSYIIGANTGAGALAPFGSIGAPNVRFDQALTVQKNGAATLGGASIGTASIIGNAASINFAASLFPSTGLAPGQYGWNIWPRGGVAGVAGISDFAPNNATIAAVPEPGTWAMMLLGFGAVGWSVRRRKGKRLPACA